ncbi:hypothetical protein JL09_g6556 [Pichia kudriavzevii]|uniref:Uncharacterized protein n=1 Tax=Pichia kudriavzevii TaxID=4909 RepID=A0A099NQR3_PICKU|nr:hypothetical protein JL09_g6556 [Pichia kudriavzevii]
MANSDFLIFKILLCE